MIEKRLLTIGLVIIGPKSLGMVVSEAVLLTDNVELEQIDPPKYPIHIRIEELAMTQVLETYKEIQLLSIDKELNPDYTPEAKVVLLLKEVEPRCNSPTYATDKLYIFSLTCTSNSIYNKHFHQ